MNQYESTFLNQLRELHHDAIATMQKNISTSDCFQPVSRENKQTISEHFALTSPGA
jgi:hypothetical protein